MNAFLDCLLRLDVRGMRELTARHMPFADAEKMSNDADVLAAMHIARVDAAAVPTEHKAYSKAWLVEREMEKREAVAEAVGAASNARDIGLKNAIEKSMSRAVVRALDGGLDMTKDAAEIRRMMLDARAAVKAGRISV